MQILFRGCNQTIQHKKVCNTYIFIFSASIDDHNCLSLGQIIYIIQKIITIHLWKLWFPIRKKLNFFSCPVCSFCSTAVPFFKPSLVGTTTTIIIQVVIIAVAKEEIIAEAVQVLRHRLLYVRNVMVLVITTSMENVIHALNVVVSEETGIHDSVRS